MGTRPRQTRAARARPGTAPGPSRGCGALQEAHHEASPRGPFSLARVVKVTASGQVIYRAEKPGCRPFPKPAGRDLFGGVPRNFQVFDALDSLAELTQHIPDQGEHLARYDGWYSHRARGVRAGAGSFSRRPQTDDPSSHDSGERRCLTPSADLHIDRQLLRAAKTDATRRRPARSWALLIQRVWEVTHSSATSAAAKCRSSVSSRPVRKKRSGEFSSTAAYGKDRWPACPRQDLRQSRGDRHAKCNWFWTRSSRAGVWSIFRPISATSRIRAGRKHGPDPLESGKIFHRRSCSRSGVHPVNGYVGGTSVDGTLRVPSPVWPSPIVSSPIWQQP